MESSAKCKSMMSHCLAKYRRAMQRGNRYGADLAMGEYEAWRQAMADARRLEDIEAKRLAMCETA